MCNIDTEAIIRLWNSTDEADWIRTATYDYMQQVLHHNPNNGNLENYMDNLNVEPVLANSESFFTFLHDRLFPWKFSQGNILEANLNRLNAMNAVNREYAYNRMRELCHSLNGLCTNDIYQSDLIYNALSIHNYIDGMGVACASGMLSVMFPRLFGTVDRFVRISLCAAGIMEPTANPECDIDIDEAVRMENIMIGKSLSFENENITPRVIDKALWTMGHDRD